MSEALARIDATEAANASEAGEVPAGYKRTEVGVIPEDWDVTSLGSCLRATPDYGINAPAVPFDESLPTYLRITDIGEDNKHRPSPRVSVSHPSSTSYLLAKGELVFARTGASTGKSYLYSPVDGELAFAGFLIRVKPDPERLDSTYFAYAVQSERYWRWVATMSTRSGQPGINAQEYNTFRFPFPKIHEQRAIAKALSSVDDLLESLDALITKKRAIKQAAMQQLLTGKIRLPGFTQEWETKRLGQIAPLQRGFDLPTSRIRPGPYAVVYSNGVLQHHERAVCKGPGVITGRSGTIGKVHFVERDYWPHNTSLWVTSFGNGEPKFIYYLLSHIGLGQFLSGSGVPTLNRNDVHQHLVRCPPPQEQHAIVVALSDMDTEIGTLEARRDKNLAIKQGMMQQLLTGRTRLV